MLARAEEKKYMNEVINLECFRSTWMKKMFLSLQFIMKYCFLCLNFFLKKPLQMIFFFTLSFSSSKLWINDEVLFINKLILSKYFDINLLACGINILFQFADTLGTSQNCMLFFPNDLYFQLTFCPFLLMFQQSLVCTASRALLLDAIRSIWWNSF